MNNNNDKRNNQQGEEEELKIYGPGGSTLQTPEEHQRDQSIDPGKDNTLDVSNDDLHTTDVERMQQDLDGKRGDIPEIDDTLGHEK